MTDAVSPDHFRDRADRFLLIVAAMLPLLAAAGVALLTGLVQRDLAASPERAVLLTGALYAGLGVAWLAVLVAVRRAASIAEWGLGALLGVLVLALAAYLFWAASSVLFPADVLLWSEGPFVSDVLKVRLGRPLYGPPADLDSFFYTPGAQLLTQALARLGGAGMSIPAFRVIQLVYVTAAVLISVRTAWKLSALAGVESAIPKPMITALWSALLFLAATNSLTNPFAHLLHNDSLALLVSAGAFAVLVEYAATRRQWLLFVGALLPAAGFLVKQSLGIWAGLFGIFLLLFDRPRSWWRVVSYGAGAGCALAITYGVCRLLWGTAFQYWTVTSMAHHPISLLRVFQHVLDSWAYFVVAVAGGALMVMRERSSRLVGLWLVALVLLVTEAYTSGIAWMLNHLGPGSLLASIMMCVALVRLWPRGGPVGERGWWAAVPTASACAVVALAASGLGMVRIPLPSVTADHARYVAAIEGEFAGLPADRVLLDAGTWVYIKPSVIMKDRGAAVGELGNNGVGDFSGLLSRVTHRWYARILVRDFDAPDFAYDHFLWPKPSGIRDALRANYRVVRVIPGIEKGWRVPSLHSVSVLEPLPASGD